MNEKQLLTKNLYDYTTLVLLDTVDYLIADLKRQADLSGLFKYDRKRAIKRMQSKSAEISRATTKTLYTYEGMQDEFADFGDFTYSQFRQKAGIDAPKAAYRTQQIHDTLQSLLYALPARIEADRRLSVVFNQKINYMIAQNKPFAANPAYSQVRNLIAEMDAAVEKAVQ